MTAALQQQTQQGPAVEALMVIQQQLMQQMEEQRKNSERMLNGFIEVVRAHRQRPTLIDNKGIGRPDPFNSIEAEWRMFEIKFGNYVVGAFPKAREVLKWAADFGGEEITEEARKDRWGEDVPDGMDNVEDFDSQLFSALSSLVKGEGFDIVTNTESRSGLDAYRRLARRFDPATSGRRRNLMKQVLNPGQYGNDKLRQAIEKWEKLVREFENKRGTDGARKTIDEDIKIGVLQEMIKDKALQDHLFLKPQNTYEATRREVMDYLEAKVKVDEDGVAPMDIGYFAKAKGKGKGADRDKTCDNCGKKGHVKKDCWAPGGGASKAGKAGQAGKGKDRDITCSNCHKKGHMRKDCWAPGGGASQKAQGGKDGKGGKGKGKGGKSAKGGKGINEIAEAQEETQEPERELGSFGLFSLDLLGVEHSSHQDGLQEMEVTFDTGAAVSAIPPSCVFHNKVKEPTSKQEYLVASGGRVRDVGSVQTDGYNENWDSVNAEWRVTNPSVRKPLASAVKCLQAGNRVVLDMEEGSYIVNKRTGKKTPMYVKDGVIKFKLWLKKGLEPEVCSMSADDDKGENDIQAVDLGGPAPAEAAKGVRFRRLVRMKP